MNKKATVSLGNALDIAHAANLKGRLETALHKQLPVVLVASNIERADTAGLQLVYAFIEAVQHQGGSVTWQKPTDVLIQASEILGMSKALNLAYE
ncbi:STAS domain-containing protein [Aliikangiella maris]|uniref:STAS domain-containing protein n=2 Tax=Aliikangiella maris TaxID=3162458 RepID=A0ABV3MPH1_9GAMM